MKNKSLSLSIIALIFILILGGFLSYGYYQKKTYKLQRPIVTMEIENYGTVKMELYPDMAPNTVKNFIALVNNGFYNGKTISEIGDSAITGGFDLNTGEEKSKEESKKDDSKKDDDTEEDKYVQGPKMSNVKSLGENEEDTAYSIKGEFVEAGYTDNTLSHQKGILTMARKTYNDYQYQISLMQMMGQDSYLSSIVSLLNDSATSGFSIMTKNDISYDGEYAAFGKVIEGMDIIEKISKVEVKKETTNKDKKNEDNEEENTAKTPKKEIKISKVTVDTKGEKYNAPEVTSKVDFDSLFSQLMSSMQSAGN